MSQVRWHYEHSIYEETSNMLFFFEGTNASVLASNPCGEDDEGHDLAELFVKGKEVNLPLHFVHCHGHRYLLTLEFVMLRPFAGRFSRTHPSHG